MTPGIKRRNARRAAAWLLAASCSLPAAGVREEGISAFRQGRYSEALAKLQTIAKSDTTAAVFLGMTQAALNNCNAALPNLITVKEPAGDLLRIANLAAAKCYSALGEDEQTFKLLEQLGKQYPNDADVLYLTAKLHMRAFNETTFRMFQRAPASYRVHELSAEVFETQNRFADAADEYRKAIALNPAAPDLHFRLGRALLLGNHEEPTLNEASAAFRAELALSPEDGACEFQLGQIDNVRGRAGDAKPHFERALALSPDFVGALIALGKLETQARNSTRAISLLKRATGLQPANETAHYTLMTAYRDAGDMENAQREKQTLDRLQKPAEGGEFSEFLKKLGEKKPDE